MLFLIDTLMALLWSVSQVMLIGGLSLAADELVLTMPLTSRDRCR
ncbi:MAG: hypothetical protein AAFV53_34310 [Myxococcota bacterium]